MLWRREAAPAAAALFIVVGALGACGPRIVALDPKKIVGVGIHAGDGTWMCANQDLLPMRAFVRYRDGKMLATRGAPGERPDAWIRDGEFHWSASVGTITPGAEAIVIPPDRMSWVDRPISIQVAVARQPSITSSIQLTPRYDCGYASATGGGGLGGGLGYDGGRGAPGRRAHVALAYVDLPGQRRWVLARVQVDGVHGVRHFLVDPSTPGRFTVDASGGGGGDGGQGVSGSDGSNGSDGSDGSDSSCSSGGNGNNGGNGGDGGDGGPGGNGGDGGDGGIVMVEYDERFPELTRVLRYVIEGGEPGVAGPGGRAGSGGDGGKGGDGGRGNTSNAKDCYGSDGSSGRDGSDGSSGREGVPGGSGRPGRPGEVRARGADVAALFSDELARGAPITGTNVGAPEPPAIGVPTAPPAAPAPAAPTP